MESDELGNVERQRAQTKDANNHKSQLLFQLLNAGYEMYFFVQWKLLAIILQYDQHLAFPSSKEIVLHKLTAIQHIAFDHQRR